MRGTAAILVSAMVLLFAPAAAGAQADYIVGPQDRLSITVFDDQELSGGYEVELDGTLTFPLIGQVKASGLTLRELEETVTAMLADGFLRQPQVNVAVDQDRSQQIFMLGEVRAPGSYPFTGQMTLIEALARAGSTTGSAGARALVIRRTPAATPGAPGDAGVDQGDDRTEVINVDLTKLNRGAPDENIVLHPGDTVIVERAELIYVFGQVNSPGAYPLQPGTTVLQALSLAGGLTDRGATGRIDVIREVDGEQQEIRVSLDYVVQPGDTIVVPQRYF